MDITVTWKHRGGTIRRKEKREGARDGPTAALKDLPQLRRVWSGRKGAEKDSGLVYEIGERVAPIFRAEYVIEGKVAMEVALTRGGMQGTLEQDVVPCVETGG